MSGGMDRDLPESFAVQNRGDGIIIPLPQVKEYQPPIVEADATYDLHTDTILVRVRRRYRDRDGTLHRRGVTFRITDEMLMKTAEGCEYPHKSIDRFESIIDETE